MSTTICGVLMLDPSPHSPLKWVKRCGANSAFGRQHRTQPAGGISAVNPPNAPADLQHIQPKRAPKVGSTCTRENSIFRLRLDPYLGFSAAKPHKNAARGARECVRTGSWLKRWNQFTKTPVPKGRAILAPRFSAGESGTAAQSPRKAARFSHTLASPGYTRETIQLRRSDRRVLAHNAPWRRTDTAALGAAYFERHAFRRRTNKESPCSN